MATRPFDKVYLKDREGEGRQSPLRNPKGQLASQPNMSIKNVYKTNEAGKEKEGQYRNFKGDSKRSTDAQRAEAQMAANTRTRQQRTYDMKRAFGVAVG